MSVLYNFATNYTAHFESARYENVSKLLRVVQSTLAAAIGVQSKENRERDFEEGNAGTFIVAGVLFTVLFVATIVVVVSAVTP